MPRFSPAYSVKYIFFLYLLCQSMVKISCVFQEQGSVRAENLFVKKKQDVCHFCIVLGWLLVPPYHVKYVPLTVFSFFSVLHIYVLRTIELHQHNWKPTIPYEMIFCL